MVVSAPKAPVFYKGQAYGTIQAPDVMFLDPGDTFKIYTTLCIEKSAQYLRTYYNKDGNMIEVSYPSDFLGK